MRTLDPVRSLFIFVDRAALTNYIGVSQRSSEKRTSARSKDISVTTSMVYHIAPAADKVGIKRLVGHQERT
jgi:hypothetical protein